MDLKIDIVTRARVLVEYIEDHVSNGKDINSDDVLKDIEIAMINFAMSGYTKSELQKVKRGLITGKEHPNSLMNENEVQSLIESLPGTSPD